jgi:hypothetical protein
MKKWGLLVALLAGLLSAARAQQAEELPQEDWIKTDRPDNTDSPATLEKGQFQLEGGVLFRRDTEQGVRKTEFLYPRMLLRYGLLDFLELRLSGDHRSEERSPLARPEETVQTRDLNALTVGAKIRMYEGEGLRPSIGFITNLTLPFYSPYAPLKVAPMFRLALSHELTESLSFQYNLGWERAWEEGEVLGQGIYTAALENEFSKRFVAFVEVFGEKAAGESLSHSLDGGLLFRLRPNLQLDAWAGKGLSANAPDYFFSTGIAYRLPR